jgi:hypothetical protein
MTFSRRARHREDHAVKMLRYQQQYTFFDHVELDGVLTKVLAIAKMRGFDHSKELRLYDITADGLVIGEPLEGVLVGKPRRLLRTD